MSVMSVEHVPCAWVLGTLGEVTLLSPHSVTAISTFSRMQCLQNDTRMIFFTRAPGAAE